MLVHAPELKIQNGMLRVSTRIEYEKALPRVPKLFWFEMPAAQEKYLTQRADTFVANLLQVAMIRNEPLRLRGTVSAKLVQGIAEYQHAVSAWRRHPYTQIRLEPEAVVEVTEPLPTGVGLPFSGGVDSFFTLWSHLGAQETMPSRRVTHGIFLRGDDIALAEEPTYRECIELYTQLFESLGLELLTCGSNIRDFYPGGNWAWSAFPHLAGYGLLFDKLFHTFYLAAGRTYWDWFQYERLALFDHLFSTETLEIVHDGLGFSRAAKIATLVKWEPVRKHLRVCFDKPNGVTNCCRCRKCLDTMVALDLAGELKNMPTFPLGYTRKQLVSTTFPLKVCPVLNDTRTLALQQGRRDIAFDLAVVIAISLARGALGKTTEKLKRVLA